MVATHTMKINGILYRSGEEIPSPGEKPVEKAEEKAISKSEIMTMKASDLRVLAKKNGIEDAEDYTGSELKKMLIDKLL